MISLNVQPPEQLVTRDDGALDIVSIWQTIQGEGPLAGTPAIFVRLAGCNLGGLNGPGTCGFCDTDYTSDRKLIGIDDIAERIREAKGESSIKLLVLTGGEPFRQSIGRFVTYMMEMNWEVQIETNGTIFREDLPYELDNLTTVCSPKTPKINQSLVPYISAFKYILDADSVDLLDGLPTKTMGGHLPPVRPPEHFDHSQIFVQPLDVQDPLENRRHQEAAIQSCLKHNYRISIQTHKLLGLA